MKTLLQIEPGYEAALAAAGLADFDAMMCAPAGAPVGWHTHRETVPIRITVDGQPRQFFLKRVFQVPPKHAFWPLLRWQVGRSQPWREWHTLADLAAASIPAMKRVAFGERRRWGMPRQAFLLVETVPMQYTLENWLLPGFPKPPPVEKRLRDHLLYELGMLIRRMHEAGFDWPDFGAKHIFAAPAVKAEGRRCWDFRLIDVERMTKRAKTAGAVSAPPVFIFGPAVEALLLDRSDANRLLAGFFLTDGSEPIRITPSPSQGEGWGEGHPDRPSRATPRGAGARLDRHGIPARLWSHVEGRSVTLPDDYEHPAGIEFVQQDDMLVNKPSAPILQAAGLNSLERVFEGHAGGQLSKPGLASHRDRARIEGTDNHGRSRILYLKRYRKPPWFEQWRRAYEWRAMQSTAAREAHYIEKLLRLGIPAPRVVAYGQRMHACIEERSFIITEEIGGQSVEKLVANAGRHPSLTASWSERQEIIRQLAAITRRLHRNRLYHRDLYLSHVFLSRNADGGIVLHLIDLARMIEPRRRRRRWQIKDLAALDYSSPHPLVARADRLRFLYHYLLPLQRSKRGRGGCTDLPGGGGSQMARTPDPPTSPSWKSEVRRIIRDVQARVRQMARHDANRARRLARCSSQDVG